MLVRYGHNAEGKQVRQALVYTKTEHNTPSEKIDSEAIKIIQRLNSQGFEAYIVGGAIRDLLIGHVPKDFDIATSAEPSTIRRIFKNSRIIGKRFRLVHIFFSQKIYEVSTFRSTEDGSVGNKFGTIEEDVHRRDFTLNALYYDPIHEHIIDYVGGVKDIRSKKIRPIIPLSVIFYEDPVRMIRAIKYAAMTNSSIPFFAKLKIRKNAYLLGGVSPSRITEEINKIIFSGHSCKIVKMLLDFNLYVYIQPAACVFIDQSAKFKKIYLDNLSSLDASIINTPYLKQGHCLIHLIQDYLNLITNPTGNAQEIYNYVYRECRHFILPMNPQRRELEYAVKTCLNSLGFNIPIERNSPRSLKHDSPSIKPVRRKKKTKKQEKGVQMKE